MLIGILNSAKVYSFKGGPETPDSFFVKAMNSWFIRRNTKAYHFVKKLLSDNA